MLYSEFFSSETACRPEEERAAGPSADCMEEKESRIVKLGKGFYIGKISLCTPIMRGNEETAKRSHGAEADATQSRETELKGFAAEGGEDHLPADHH